VQLIEYAAILWNKRWIVLTAFLSTVVATVVLTYLETPTYEATSSFIISPTGVYDDFQSMVDVLDAMSRRSEIAGTYAQVASSRTIKEQAAVALGLSSNQLNELSVNSQVLPDTNVLEITVKGSDPRLVKVFADAVGVKVATYVQGLYEAYGLRLLDQASLPADPISPDGLINVALGGMVGLAGGIGLALALYYFDPYLNSVMEQVLPVTQSDSAMEARGEGRNVDRRRILRWFGLAVLVLVLSVAGAMVWLSQRDSETANRPTAILPTLAFPTPGWSAMIEGTATPLSMVSSTPTMELTPTLCPFPSGWVPHEVQITDTLSSLADRYDLTIAEIVDANCLTKRVISKGQTVFLPPMARTPMPSITATEGVNFTLENEVLATDLVTNTAEVSPSICIPPEGWTTLHVVQTEDSLNSLSLTYGVSIREIMAANCLESTSLFADLQELYLPPLPEELNDLPAGTEQLEDSSTNNATLVVYETGTSLTVPVLVALTACSEAMKMV
jgi:capsular polysaccharide biosynthesis protein/LysM repeat protein